MDRIRAGWAWVRRSPTRALAVGVVALAAVCVGLLFGVVIGGREADPGLGSVSSTAPSASVMASTSVDPTDDPSPSISPEPPASARQSAEPTADAAIAAPEATAAATQAPPSDGFGGMPAPSEVPGDWEQLADLPGSGLSAADAIVLPDGRVAVFRWDSGGSDPETYEVVVYDPESDIWDVVEFATNRPEIGTKSSFALGSDGRLYSHTQRIDISGTPWMVEPFDLVREGDQWAGTNLSVGDDGLIYRRADDTGSGRTELIGFDASTETFTRSARTSVYGSVAHGGPHGIVLFGSADGQSAIVVYDPDADVWGPIVASPIDLDYLDAFSGAVDADGRVWVMASEGASLLYVLQPGDGTVASLLFPGETSIWSVELVWTDDGTLYAIGDEEAWAFTPGA